MSYSLLIMYSVDKINVLEKSQNIRNLGNHHSHLMKYIFKEMNWDISYIKSLLVRLS